MFIDHLFCVTITSESQSRAVGVFTELYAHPALLSGITFTKPRMGMLGNLGRFKYIWTAGYTSRNKKAASFRAFLFPINQTCNSFSLMSKKSPSTKTWQQDLWSSFLFHNRSAVQNLWLSTNCLTNIPCPALLWQFMMSPAPSHPSKPATENLPLSVSVNWAMN